MLFQYLKEDNFRVRILKEYVLGEDGQLKKKTSKTIAFINSEMIHLIRKFVS